MGLAKNMRIGSKLPVTLGEIPPYPPSQYRGYTTANVNSLKRESLATNIITQGLKFIGGASGCHYEYPRDQPLSF